MTTNSREFEQVKKDISKNFSASAEYYDQHAGLQKDIAKRLIASLRPWRDIIPSGPIMELGCGTGFVTEGLAEIYNNREIKAVDLAEGMVNFCRPKFAEHDNISFEVSDAEVLPVENPQYAMTVTGFVAQWFKDPALTLARWLEVTKPGGLLLASFPGNESFPQWRKICQKLGLPFTANPYPDVEEMVVKMSLGPSQVDYYEDTVTQEFDSAADFFEHLKKTGSATRLSGRSLSPEELSLLIDYWDSSTEGSVKVSYHVIFLAVKRDYDS